MIALSLRFPAGRYHATPWGRHVNEAALAWPPEPLRIVRALIACHYRKGNERFSNDQLADLIDTLADQPPIYRLPEAVRGHTRHYMPSPVNTTLVFDAFARLDPTEPMIIGWPGLTLGADQRIYLDHLVARLGYLGRAESWVEAETLEWNGQGANARPVADQTDNSERVAPTDSRLAFVYAPLSANAYREARARLIAEERDRRRAAWTRNTPLTDEAIDRALKDFHKTLPERLAAALAVDTSDLHSVGWSGPPAAQRLLYSTPELTANWPGARRQRAARVRPDPTVARFVLVGRPRPRIEDTVQIAEIMRLAAMAKFGWSTVESKRRPNAPSVISGYGLDGKALRGDNHAHAYWLPEDADGDGEIDHVAIFASGGFDAECCKKLDRITNLWIERRQRSDEEEQASTARKEWRLALEGFGHPEDFAPACSFFAPSRRWTSTTPYLMPWYPKKDFGWEDQIARELKQRGAPEMSERPRDIGSVRIKGRERRPIHFRRVRSRRGLQQPDALGRFVELTFKEPLAGPLALGFASHFGLGLFVPKEGSAFE